MKEGLEVNKRGISKKLVSFIHLCLFSCGLISVIWVSQFFGITFSLPYNLWHETSVVDSFLHAKATEYAERGSKPSNSSLISNGTMYCDRNHSRTDICFMKGCETSIVDSFWHAKTNENAERGSKPSNSSLISNGTMYCDRSHSRTDICFMKGDLRTNSSSSSIFLYTSVNSEPQELIVRPYTRKFEAGIMNTIKQLHLISKLEAFNSDHKCDVFHHVPALFFSVGGYTGNLYHGFSDGLIPLYITSRHFNKKVIFVIQEYQNWWYDKYAQVLSQLSDYPPIDFKSDRRTHCFQEATVGLRYHDELAINSTMMPNNETILDFHNLLVQALEPHSQNITEDHKKRPKSNQNLLVELAEKIGFSVQVLEPNFNMKLSKIYNAISTSDVMVGVHGAALTHLLFLKPGSTFIQVVPLGANWPSKTYFGEPSKKFGLKYIEYKIDPMESSLYNKYDQTDPVLRDPDSLTNKGWDFIKFYLDNQIVTLNLTRFDNVLSSAYADYFNFMK